MRRARFALLGPVEAHRVQSDASRVNSTGCRPCTIVSTSSGLKKARLTRAVCSCIRRLTGPSKTAPALPNRVPGIDGSFPRPGAAIEAHRVQAERGRERCTQLERGAGE